MIVVRPTAGVGPHWNKNALVTTNVTTNQLIARSVDLLSTSAAKKKSTLLLIGKSPHSGEEKIQPQQPCPTIIPVWPNVPMYEPFYGMTSNNKRHAHSYSQDSPLRKRRIKKLRHGFSDFGLRKLPTRAVWSLLQRLLSWRSPYYLWVAHNT